MISMFTSQIPGPYLSATTNDAVSIAGWEQDLHRDYNQIRALLNIGRDSRSSLSRIAKLNITKAIISVAKKECPRDIFWAVEALIGWKFLNNTDKRQTRLILDALQILEDWESRGGAQNIGTGILDRVKAEK